MGDLMILYFVLVGFVTGALCAAAVLATGGGVLLALLAYASAGALGVVLSAILWALAPPFPKPRVGRTKTRVAFRPTRIPKVNRQQ